MGTAVGEILSKGGCSIYKPCVVQETLAGFLWHAVPPRCEDAVATVPRGGREDVASKNVSPRGAAHILHTRLENGILHASHRTTTNIVAYAVYTTRATHTGHGRMPESSPHCSPQIDVNPNAGSRYCRYFSCSPRVC
jgi:hypothetical protein